ncbi:MAG: L-threonylcarbamoyladenylate synthase [Pseudomonadota bacterium]
MRTEELLSDASGIARAVALLSDGQLVAFPTETVYGLGADATNDVAVAKVFEAKGRPSFNPLIVHVASLDAAEAVGHIPDAARPFLGDGWPAGLTLVVPQRPDNGISRLATVGQPTVAVRVPVAPVALDLLRTFGRPVAAPSANPSGRLSPTRAGHVLTGLGGKIAAVLSGGETEAGLESTILAFDESGPLVLREGAFAVPDGMRRNTTLGTGAVARAPGMLSSHYAPQGTLRMDVTQPEPGDWYIGYGQGHSCDANLSPSGDLREAAANLFAFLHQADEKPTIAVAPIPDTGPGRAINDRLRRAAAPRG